MTREQEPPFYLVWSKQGRTPVYEHPSRSSAANEAERLARMNPGQDFFVLMPVSVTLRQDVVTRKFITDEIPF